VQYDHNNWEEAEAILQQALALIAGDPLYAKDAEELKKKVSYCRLQVKENLKKQKAMWSKAFEKNNLVPEEPGEGQEEEEVPVERAQSKAAVVEAGGSGRKYPLSGPLYSSSGFTSGWLPTLGFLGLALVLGTGLTYGFMRRYK